MSDELRLVWTEARLRLLRKASFIEYAASIVELVEWVTINPSFRSYQDFISLS